MLLAMGCASETGPTDGELAGGSADDLACMGATRDAGGYCRSPDGRFAPERCCELEELAECIAETEECLGHIEDMFYAESCGDNYSASMCVSEEACPEWIFEDPERTPHEILDIDITEQCHYVCIEWLPDCMYDMVYDEAYDVDGALEACRVQSGCDRDLCDIESDLCDEVRADFEESRASMEPTEPDPDPTEPEEWTLEQCMSEAEECIGHTEDETFLDACGDEPSGSVCVNDESCPQWIFEDPDRTPLEILDIDISYQCEYVCSQYLPDCMFDMGYEDGTIDEAFETCISESGCQSTICDADPALCEEATERWNDARE